METNEQEILHVNKHICLKSPIREYASKLYKIINYNRDNFCQFMAWPKFVTNETDTANFLDNCVIEHQRNLAKTYVILFNDDPVGLLSFNQIDKANKTACIGYWLDSQVQGKGIMTEAVKTRTNFYAENRIIKRFVIKCSIDNSKSNQVAKRCGFSYEGTLKQAEYLNGIYHDQNIYGLTSIYL